MIIITVMIMILGAVITRKIIRIETTRRRRSNKELLLAQHT
jgi:hypothetical protein